MKKENKELAISSILTGVVLGVTLFIGISILNDVSYETKIIHVFCAEKEGIQDISPYYNLTHFEDCEINCSNEYYKICAIDAMI